MSRINFTAVENVAIERLFDCSSDSWRLWLAARVHNATQLNDGAMVDRDLLIIAVAAGLGVDEMPAAAADLVKHHAWKRTKAGWQDPHHCDHNDSLVKRMGRRQGWNQKKAVPPKIVPVEKTAASGLEATPLPPEKKGEFHGRQGAASQLSSQVLSSHDKTSPVTALGRGAQAVKEAAGNEGPTIAGGASDSAGDVNGEAQLSETAAARARVLMDEHNARKAATA